MHVGAFRSQAASRSPSGGQNRKAEIADMAAQLAVLRVIVDELNVGIVLLDSEHRVQFINRAFRRSWRVPEAMVTSELTFTRLICHGRSTEAYAGSPDRMDEYVTKQMNLIKTGEEGPLQIRFADGTVSQFRCKALPNGGRLLTYGNVSELTHQADALEQLASVDGMTGLNNRRNFMVLAESEWSRFKRYGRPLALLMIDIDLFKSVNDTYGHDAGDEVIKSVAEILQSHKRASDIVGRLGGEEFALILPEATLDRAASAGERFRQLVADRVVTAGERSISVTISIGASVCHADTSGIDELLKQADVALYQAKRSGRNRVCRFDPYKPTELAIASTQTP
jgi:diguanylate cyclase (GGDEF)-like protein